MNGIRNGLKWITRKALIFPLIYCIKNKLVNYFFSYQQNY